MTENSVQELAERFVALWNEPDPGLRRKAIEELWAQDGVHLLHPPQEIREMAAGLGFDGSVLEAQGYDAIETRVARSHAEFVASGQLTFRPAGEAVRLRNVVKLAWEAVPPGGEAAGGGVDVLVLDEHGRIEADYMFPG
ncbi:hypothetical protein [Actinomadura hibisca]|uniref:hypothetical protein n=1 Tax=Actinomadura hibisca TaxID=68565 RepID=UPI000831E811|nr:hypothetical protein [Actinomadura hibisca]